MKIICIYLFCLIPCLSYSQDVRYICPVEDLEVVSLENINTRSIEFSPVYYQDGLVYVVAKEKTRVFDPKTGQAYFDLMYVDVGPHGETSKSVNFSPNIRTQYHEGPCTFNEDGSELFFTRSNYSGAPKQANQKEKVQLKIYRAVQGPEDWEQITELPFSSNTYSVAHPALSPDGQYLVFASDMPGGYGGMDLYVVNRVKGTWSEPVNLGSEINTKGNEVFPFWHPEQYLFFSSDGHKGDGGLDLFISAANENGTFIGLQRLDKPFNSSKDDLGLIVSEDGTSGYFGSNRKPTKGKDDLYRWTSPVSIFCKAPSGNILSSDILVMDQGNNPVESAYIWIIPMNNEGPSLFKEHFSTELVPKDEKEGAFYLRWGVTDTLSVETADAISDAMGKATLTTNKKSTYILVAQHNGYQPHVEITAGNKIPSTIHLKRILEDGAPCFNTMFTIYNATGETQLNGARIQLTGPCLKSPLVFYTDENGFIAQCLLSGCTLKAEIKQEGYAQHAFTFTVDEADEHWKIYLKSSEFHTTPPSPIVSGTVIVLDNIYYDFNKSVIRKGDAAELIALANIMKQYPDLTIELTSHTDTRGTAEYNMELSKRRSESSKSYLELQGIKGNRIITNAAGETLPRNKCLDGVPCTEEEHQFNRRTEVKIINPAQGMEIRYKSKAEG